MKAQTAKPIDLSAIPTASSISFTAGNRRRTVCVLLYSAADKHKPIMQLVVTQEGLADFIRRAQTVLFGLA